MNNTKDIDISKYECYYALKSLLDFTIFRRTPDGDVEYVSYDVFQADDYQIIAFYRFDISHTDYNYVLVNSEGETVVQWIPYEHFYGYIEQPSRHPEDDTFTFYNSVSMEQQVSSNEFVAWDYENRCETHLYMAVGYKVQDGVKPFMVDLEKFNNSNVLKATSLISVAGTASISYLKVANVGTSYRDWPAVVGMSKTLMGCMKLAIEWASLADEPFNCTDELVLDAKAFFELMDFPQEVIDEINEYQEDMPVYRYFAGVEDARHSFIEQTDIPPLFLKWLKSHLRYLSLDALVSNMENPPNIDTDVLVHERNQFEETLYAAAHRYSNNEDSMTVSDFFDILNSPNTLTAEESNSLHNALLWYRAVN